MPVDELRRSAQLLMNTGYAVLGEFPVFRRRLSTLNIALISEQAGYSHMTIYEADVPGVGRKFEVDLDGDEQLVIIIHHDGKREVYHRPSPDVDSEKLFSLSGKLARQVGSILQGAYFQPVETDEIEVPLGEAIIEWVDVDEESDLVSQSLRDASIRQQTGVSVIAVQRSSETISNPKPEFTIEAGDILVTLGTREEQDALEQMLVNDQSTDESV